MSLKRKSKVFFTKIYSNFKILNYKLVLAYESNYIVIKSNVHSREVGSIDHPTIAHLLKL